MYQTPLACPNYGICPGIKLSLSKSDCKALVNELDNFLRKGQEHEGSKIEAKAEKLIQYWRSLEFKGFVNLSFKYQGIFYLERICQGRLTGFEASFVLGSCTGYFNQVHGDATNLEKKS